MKKISMFLFLLLTFFSFTKVSNALTNISINNNKLIPDFNINTKVYNVYVSSKTEIITINIEAPEDEIVTGGGSKSLKKGLNEIEINVYKNNKQTDKYTLNIVRGTLTYDKKEATLETLKIENHDIDFIKDNFNYIINANLNENRLNISYIPTNPKSNVKVIGDINLNKEKNIIKLIVSSEDKKVNNTYTIKVNKEINVTDIKKKKESIFNKKEFSPYQLKLIIALLIVLGLSLLGTLFYFLFIKKNKKRI